MKYIILALAALMILSTSESFSKGPFSLNKADLNLGIGLGSTLGGDEVLPPISASYEVGFPWKTNEFTEKVSLGGYVGFAQTEYDWYWGTWSYTHIIVGARGSYHFYNEDNIDAYGGLMIGYDILSSSYKSKIGYEDYNYSDADGSGLRWVLKIQLFNHFLKDIKNPINIL